MGAHENVKRIWAVSKNTATSRSLRKPLSKEPLTFKGFKRKTENRDQKRAMDRPDCRLCKWHCRADHQRI
ncbi:hypothetical protein PO124_07945 [Bacillus licheniformis]|nr:hypothetical protein [Bacillus licheniformis]